MIPTNILERIEKRLAPALANYPIAALYAFGSAISGTNHRASDVDMAVVFGNEDVPEEERLRVLDEITATAEQQLGIGQQRADVSDLERLPLPLRFRIIQQGKLAYCQDMARLRHEQLRTTALYHDALPAIKAANQRFLERTSTEI